MRVNRVVCDSVELMVRLAAADCALMVDELSDPIARSPSSTAALLTRLQQADLVRASEGPPKAYFVSRPAALITVADVFEAVDWGEDPFRPSDHRDAARPIADAIVEVDLLEVVLKNYSWFFLRGISLAGLVIDAKIALSNPYPPRVAATHVGPGWLH